jgi:hypothetical protein
MTPVFCEWFKTSVRSSGGSISPTLMLIFDLVGLGRTKSVFWIGLRRSLLCSTLTARTRQKTSPGLLPTNSTSPNVPCSVEKLLRNDEFLPFLPFHFKNL